MKNVNVNSTLSTISENKAIISDKQLENKKLFKELFIIINEEVKNIRSNSMFKDTKKSALVTIAKANLKVDVKDFGLFSLVCNYVSMGLSLDLNNDEVTVNTIKRVVYFINKGMLTKTKANKSDDIKALVSELNKQLKESK